MKILLAGATGFVGRHLANALEAAGHEVHAAVRHPSRAHRLSPTLRAKAIDFTLATRAADWLPLATGMDVVVNAVGILRESRRQPFELIHHRAPAALFDAAAQAGVRRIVQISALGAGHPAGTAYQRSKGAADDHLLTLGIPAAIVRPSVIFGKGGAGARLFRTMAHLPLIPLPGDGLQQLQPIHVHDLADAVVELIESETMAYGPLDFVGPEALSLREFYAKLRHALGIRRPARFLPIPMPLIETAARLGSYLPGVALDTDTLAMLNQGSVGDSSIVAGLLHRPPRPVEHFVGHRGER
ncbi:MAG: NAD(P)H-binding protein [Pigmentiphaga sp.]